MRPNPRDFNALIHRKHWWKDTVNINASRNRCQSSMLIDFISEVKQAQLNC